MNLLEETMYLLKKHKKEPKDIRFVSNGEKWCDWDTFSLKASDVNYDNSYGGECIDPYIVIVGKDWWLERGTYDGSEWWEFKKLPAVPSEKGDIDLYYEY